MDYDKIASQYSKRVGHFMDTSQDWRREQALMYAVRDHQPFIDVRLNQNNASNADAHLEKRNNTPPSLTVVSLAP